MKLNPKFKNLVNHSSIQSFIHRIIDNWAKHCPVGETMYKNSYKFRVEMSITHKRKTIVPTEGNRKVFVICFDR